MDVRARTSFLRSLSVAAALLAQCACSSSVDTDAGGAPTEDVPRNLVSTSAMALTVAPRQIHETADSIFVVRNDCLDPPGDVRIDEYAKATQISRPLIISRCGRAPIARNTSRVVNQRAGVSAELAIRLAAALGSSPEVWLNMQQAYDLWHAQKKRRPRIARLARDQAAAAMISESSVPQSQTISPCDPSGLGPVGRGDILKARWAGSSQPISERRNCLRWVAASEPQCYAPGICG
jgi:addiction module HigA family antidote